MILLLASHLIVNYTYLISIWESDLNLFQILKGDVAQSPKKPVVQDGRARAKFDFTAQTNLELPLKKGEVVVLTRRIDQNWWEGRNGTKTGIFPDSYVTILQEPSQSKPGELLNKM